MGRVSMGPCLFFAGYEWHKLSSRTLVSLADYHMHQVFWFGIVCGFSLICRLRDGDIGGGGGLYRHTGGK